MATGKKYIMKKNKSKSKTKSLFENTFNFRAWSDWDRVKSGGDFISDSVKQVVEPNTAKVVESFNDAQKRMKLTDEDIALRGRSLLRLSLFMLGLSVLLFCYAIYHFIFGTIHAGVFALALTALSAIYAFRYHFWYFQIKTRTLGCTLQEWYRQGIMGKKL
jgi:intracellular multiplication protein IcmV